MLEICSVINAGKQIIFYVESPLCRVDTRRVVAAAVTACEKGVKVM